MISYIVAGIIGIIVAYSFWYTYKAIKGAHKMYEMADVLEISIKAGASLDTVYPEFLKLHGMAFEKHTFGRIRELAKMIEVKYDIKVLK